MVGGAPPTTTTTPPPTTTTTTTTTTATATATATGFILNIIHLFLGVCCFPTWSQAPGESVLGPWPDGSKYLWFRVSSAGCRVQVPNNHIRPQNLLEVSREQGHFLYWDYVGIRFLYSPLTTSKETCTTSSSTEATSTG